MQLIGFSHDGTPYPMFIALIVCAAGALIAYGSSAFAQRRVEPMPA